MSEPFDASHIGGDVAAFGEQCKAQALAGIAADDWRDVYEWTKSWISSGGGGYLPDAWLVYAVSGLLHKQPRTAVHTIDMALQTWIGGTADRAALTWCRGLLILNHLSDPSTALLDLEDAHPSLPHWLSAGSTEALESCREAASRSRKKKASVPPRPEYDLPLHRGVFSPGASGLAAFAPDVSVRCDGDEPDVWPTVAPFFYAQPN